MKKRSAASKKIWAKATEYYILKFFLIITACPVKVYRKSIQLDSLKLSNPIRFTSFAIISLTVVCFLTIVLVKIFCFNTFNNFGVWIYLFLVSSTCLVILIESQFTYRYFIRFTMIKQNIEENLVKLCSDEWFNAHKFAFVEEYSKLLIFLQLFSWSLNLWTLFRIRNNSNWFFSCFSIMFPTMYTRLRCLQHRFYTSLVFAYVKMIRTKIQDTIFDLEGKELVARQQGQYQFQINSLKIMQELNLSKRIFTSVFQMTYLINKMFGFSILMNIFENFVHLLSHLFWIYFKLHREELDYLLGKEMRTNAYKSKCNY